jgi:phospholipase C
MRRLATAALVASLALGACAGNFSSPAGVARPQSGSGGSGSNYIQHVVLAIQENRAFDDLFATFPGADGTTYGCMKYSSGSAGVRKTRRASGSSYCPSGDEYVPLKEVNLVGECDPGHSYPIVAVDYDGARMDGFGAEGLGPHCPGRAGTYVYQYVNPSQIAPYWDIAKDYVLADHMFQTQGSGSFTAHQDLIAASTIINQPYDTQSLVDYPSAEPWGCDAPSGTKTSLLVYTGSKLVNKYHKGPFPCMTYKTLRDLLDAAGVSWKYYSPPEPKGAGKLWNAFDAIKAVREGPEWSTNIARPTQFFKDVSNGTLPSVSWIVPDPKNSDHPGNHSDTGPSWIASIVDAVGKSSYWDSTVVIVVWDDWGGMYDNVPPPFFDEWGGLGFRVGMLVVSPYDRETNPSQPGYISSTQYEFGSIVKFIEGIWNLGTLGTTDKRATSIIDCFDFTQAPRSFIAIPSSYSKNYFLHQKPSYLPVDTE